jgi:hypothetical protein
VGYNRRSLGKVWVSDSDWFEQSWEIREEEVYPRLFGSRGQNICVLTPSLFTDIFKQSTFDSRWLNYGVFECPPTTTRRTWLYVSSGLSNAWEDDHPDPTGPSGLGMEFLLESVEQAEWPILRLQHVVAFQILLACDKYPGRGLVDHHDRIPLRDSISPGSSALTWLFIGPPEPHPASFQLPTGSVDLLMVVGVTEEEVEYARERGGDDLVSLLRSRGGYPVTDPARGTVVGAAYQCAEADKVREALASAALAA